MSKEKQTQDALLDAIDIAIENKLKKIGFNYYVDGVVKGKNSDNTYNVLINGIIYKNVPSKNNFEYSDNDVVQVLIKNGNWNKKFIDDKKNHKEIPKNIHNFGERIRIRENDDFDNYTKIGSYSVYTDSDANTISNIPMNTAGNLNVYSSNGNDVDVTQYKYLIQEYTILTGSYKFIRHIRQTPAILADTETYPKGWEFRDWKIDVNSHTLNDSVVIKNTLLDLIYPVGSIYMSVNNVSPATFLGGTWEVWGSGKVPVGVNTSETEFNTVEKTGGAKTHTLTTTQMPKHTHGSKTLEGKFWNYAGQNSNYTGTANGICSMTTTDSAAPYPSSISTVSGANDTLLINATHEHDSVGSGSAHNNLQPYITCYMWKRVS